MFEDAPDVIDGVLAEVRVRAFLEEDVLLPLPETLMHVHAGAIVLEDGLGHQRHGLVVPPGHVLDDVLELQELVSHAGQGIETHVDFALAGRRHFVVVHFHVDADLLERQHHLGPDVLDAVHRRHRKVPFLVAHLVARVLRWGRRSRPLLAARVPEALAAVDVIETVVVRLTEANVVEDEELRLGPEIRGVGDPG